MASITHPCHNLCLEKRVQEEVLSLPFISIIFSSYSNIPPSQSNTSFVHNLSVLNDNWYL